jgi:ectoine hydroxylase-related dioxygenase (phytanoyl-CoA dioxygenase family)
MRSAPEFLAPADLEQFHRDGFVVVRKAFARADAAAMELRWWAELETSYGIRRDDRSTWRQPVGDLKAAKRDPVQASILTPRVRSVIDTLLGQDEWPPPSDWGRTIATFPEPGAWDVPAHLWHWDNPCAWHRNKLHALFVVSFIGPVGPRGGGTLVLAGSPRLLLRQEDSLTRAERDDFVVRRELFHRSHPWLEALTGKRASPADRVAAFMESEALIEDVPLRVVELTGEPGDMVFCHPLLVHCGAPNRGAWPRFMRIKQQLTTYEGRRLLRSA